MSNRLPEFELADVLEALGLVAKLGLTRSTTTKSRGRPLSAQTVAIRDAVNELRHEFEEMTVRQVFYRLTVEKIVPKTEAGYRSVQYQILKMRREGVLPWAFIADGTRWRSQPECWSGVEDALTETARVYRRNLWRSQGVRIEVWLEKDALASVIRGTTHTWGVALMVSRGQSSDTFVYAAAREAQTAWDEAGIETVVYALYDADKSGRVAAAKIEEKLERYSDDAPISFSLLAVTDEQIDSWDLPTRPAKEHGAPDAVELDAISPDRLNSLVNDAISSNVDADAWRQEQIVEQSEREILERIAGTS